MRDIEPPRIEDIGPFFEAARRALPKTPVMLGCARPLGAMKVEIDRLAIDAGLNGIAYPAEGIVSYAQSRGLEPVFNNACCGVSWGVPRKKPGSAPIGSASAWPPRSSWA